MHGRGTGNDMDILLLAFLSLLLGCLGIWLLRSQEKLSASNEVEVALAETASDLRGIGKCEKLFMLLLLVVNLAVAMFMRLFYGDSVLDIVNMVALLSVMWPCAWIDRKSFLIPNRLLIFGLAIRVLLIAVSVFTAPAEFVHLLLGSVVAAVALLLVSLLCRLISPGSIGFGDVKLLMLMGVFLGTDRIWGAILFSMITAFFYSLFLILTKRATRKTEIPFAPLLLAGTILASVFTTV